MGSSAKVADSPELERLAQEQAALRRVATLVAGGASSTEVFDAVAKEVAQVLHLTNAAVCRYDDDGSAVDVLAVYGDYPAVFSKGSRWPLDGPSLSATVLRTGRAGRVEDYTDLDGTLATAAREHSFGKVAGAPIVAGGRVWGVILTSTSELPLPDDLEDRLTEFTELVGTAIGNSQAHDELARIADEQAALRRVATLVAQGAAPADVFAAVSAEVARLVPAQGSALTRFEADGTLTALAGWTDSGGYVYSGRGYAREGTVSGLVFESGCAERIDDYSREGGSAAAAARQMGWHSSVGAPITVDGRLWGVLAVVSKQEAPLPDETERRLSEFTNLVATAISNSDAHEALAQLADEQAALRRVATLVAEGATPDRVFDTVRDEVARMFNVPLTVLMRYDADGMATVLATSDGYLGPVGKRWPVSKDDISALARVRHTGRAVRVDYTAARMHGAIAASARKEGVRAAVGVPVEVDGALWGVMAAGSRDPDPLPSGIEGRLVKFTQLLATAIANAESRAELQASRARIVATADATRRRIERDLHDGAQQQIVSLALELRAAQATVPESFDEHRAELSHVVEGLTGVLDDLREIALGIHPAGLSEGGLRPALKTLARRSVVPVSLELDLAERLSEAVEVTAYYVASEALTNAAKYSGASAVDIAVVAHDGVLRIQVRDEGRGGADAARGSGLVGLKDRVEAIGGTIRLTSPPGSGTTLTVVLPLGDTPPTH